MFVVALLRLRVLLDVPRELLEPCRESRVSGHQTRDELAHQRPHRSPRTSAQHKRSSTGTIQLVSRPDAISLQCKLEDHAIISWYLRYGNLPHLVCNASNNRLNYCSVCTKIITPKRRYNNLYYVYKGYSA